MSSNLLKVAYRCPICSSDQTDYITKSEGTTEFLHAGENIYAIYYETLLECKKCLNNLDVNYRFDNLDNSYEVENILDPLSQTEYYFSISINEANESIEPGFEEPVKEKPKPDITPPVKENSVEEPAKEEPEPEIVPPVEEGIKEEQNIDVVFDKMSVQPAEKDKTEEQNVDDLNAPGLDETEPDIVFLSNESGTEELITDADSDETTQLPVEDAKAEEQKAADLNKPVEEEPESDIVLSLIEEIAEEQYLEVDFETIGDQLVEEEKEETNEFLEWLKRAEIGFLHIGKNQEMFASLFKKDVKRPEYLIQTDSLGMIAVDVKTSEQTENTLSLDLDSELKKALEFERLFRMPVWFVFEQKDFSKWYWISASKAIEVGDVQVKNEDTSKVVAIDVEHFTEITGNDDLGKL